MPNICKLSKQVKCTVRLCVYSKKGDKSCVIGGLELLRQRGGKDPLSELSEVEFPTAGQGIIHNQLLFHD